MRKYLDACIVYETKDMSKEQWLEARKCGIGGSDAASVLGLNPYKSSVSVYIEKVDYIHGVSMSDKNINGCKKDSSNEEVNYRMELGNKLEDFVANEFSLKTGLKVRNVNGILKNDKYPFAIANIDRAVVGEKAFLECKVTNSYSKKVWQMGVPIHYQIQVNHYMAVTGATHCYVAALIGNEELIIHRIDRDEEIIDEIMKLEAMFWDKCILGGEIPAPDGSLDYSIVLQGLYKDSKDEELILFEQEKLLDRYDEITAIYKEIEVERKKIEQYIQVQMKEYEVGFIGIEGLLGKNKRNTIDTKKLKKEYPEIAAECMKTTTSEYLDYKIINN